MPCVGPSIHPQQDSLSMERSQKLKPCVRLHSPGGACFLDMPCASPLTVPFSMAPPCPPSSVHPPPVHFEGMQAQSYAYSHSHLSAQTKLTLIERWVCSEPGARTSGGISSLWGPLHGFCCPTAIALKETGKPRGAQAPLLGAASMVREAGNCVHTVSVATASLPYLWVYYIWF